MCCARTAALQGETKNQSECRYGFSAAMNASCRSSNCMQQACRKLSPERPKTQPGPPPNLPKSRPEASMRAKMHPRAAHKRPRGTPEAPQRRPRAPKRRPRPPKRHPRATKRRLKPSQIESGGTPERNFCVFAAPIAEKYVSEGLRERFLQKIARSADARTHKFRAKT